MRILLLTDISSHMRGGVPGETRRLIQGLCSRGHAVALASDAPLSGAEQALHMPISFPVKSALASELGGILASFEPDFIHVMCMSSKGVTQIAPLLRTHPWALTVHSVSPYERKLPGWHGQERLHYALRSLRFLPNTLMWRWVFRNAMVPRVIVHSAYVDDIVVRYGCAPGSVTLIPLPVESTQAPTIGPQRRNDGPAPLLVTVGGLAHTKGQLDVIKALPALLAEFPGLRYQMIGEIRDASYLSSLHSFAESLGVSNQVLVTPDLSDADKRAALLRADVYIQPSHEEGFCLAYAEAAAWVPRLVGTDAGAIAAMSRDDLGARVVPTRSPKAIAEAVSDLLNVQLPAGHMAERMARLSERFAFATYVKAHEELYGRERPQLKQSHQAP